MEKKTDDFEITFIEEDDCDFDEEERNLDTDIASSISQLPSFVPFDEPTDDELLRMTKLEIINFKNAQMEKLKSEIDFLMREKDDYIDNFKETTNLLLERIKELEFNQSGERPETAKILTNMSRSFSNPLGKESIDLEKHFNGETETVSCPNCAKEIDKSESIQHSLTCLRSLFKQAPREVQGVW